MKIYPTLIILTAMAAGAQAQWQLIDDFNHSEPLSGWVFTSQNVPPSYVYTPITDPVDEANTALYLESGNYGVTFGVVCMSIPLPNPIEPNTSSTIYFRYMQAGPSNQFITGTSHVAPPLPNDSGYSQGVRWSDFSSMHVFPEDGLIDIRDGGAVINEATGYVLENNVWYEMWHVVHNTFDGSVSTGTHQLYIKGPSDSEPWKVTLDTDPVRDSGNFRLAPVTDGAPQSLKYWLMATHSGSPSNPNAGDPWLVDDVYQTNGVVLSTPGDAPATWAGYPIFDAAGNVDTGSFLRWINVSFGDWIYVYDLNSYIYMPESGVQQGGAARNDAPQLFWGILKGYWRLKPSMPKAGSFQSVFPGEMILSQ